MKFTSLVTNILLAGPASVLGKGQLLSLSSSLGPPKKADSSGKFHKRDGSPITIDGATIHEGTFQQLIDHSKPSLGTFTQRFWFSSDHYSGKGAPIVVFTSGCSNGSDYVGYASNGTISGLIAQAVGGAAIVYESRYAGASTPFSVYSTANLTHQTVENHVLDAVYFAQQVQFPFDPTRSSAPDRAPWIFASGALGGAISAWTKALHDGTYWAHLASSAPVEGITDFWTYYDAAATNGPANCTADVHRVIEYMDGVFQNGTKDQVQALKEKFGFGELKEPVDMMNALAQGPGGWQSQGFSNQHDNETGAYFGWCDYVENVWPGSGNKTPGVEGVGLEHALEGYAKWSRDVLIPGYCEWFADTLGYAEWKGNNSVQCFDTFNASDPYYTDQSYNNGRGDAVSQHWLQCNEPLEWWKVAPPKNRLTLVSRLLDVAYHRRQCGLLFPAENGKTVGVSANKTAADVNKFTGGYNFTNNATRIIFSSGGVDPWVPATVSAKERAGGPLASTDQVPVLTIAGATSCEDLIVSQGDFNDGLKGVIAKEVDIMKGWVKEYYKEHNIARDFVY